jgi:A/G-specific adenine glycosylase
MLQQTRVAQGMPYYYAFTERFPTVFELANAAEQEVLKLWQGLGYYSRARNLHKTAQFIAFECKGVFPYNYKELLTLKGVGDYTAAAIASFAYNEKVPVVDGNVFRVLSRYFGVESDISLLTSKKEFQELAFALMPDDNIATFNQAIMEFGALQCVPKNPNCAICVMNNSCVALQKKRVSQLPVKSKKIKVTHRFFNYLILEDENNQTLVQQRKDKGIWHNLYEFPLIETANEVDFQIISTLVNEKALFENEIIEIVGLNQKSQLHILTHQRLYIKFWKIVVRGVLRESIDIETLKAFPFPIVIFNFIENHFKNQIKKSYI